mmetsp:Transcript_16738/g.50763  ORF Transcript_16738/g.50763 Transcript_16738/m.50763 type:complete len:94 (-) Transcript_16738:414-695(-)
MPSAPPGTSVLLGKSVLPIAGAVTALSDPELPALESELAPGAVLAPDAGSKAKALALQEVARGCSFSVAVCAFALAQCCIVRHISGSRQVVFP